MNGEALIFLRQKGVDAPVYFPLDEAAAAGGRFEINGDTLILGAPLPKLADGIDTEHDPGRDVAEIGQHALDIGRERFPAQLAQFR
jgi:hypothetical protein